MSEREREAEWVLVEKKGRGHPRTDAIGMRKGILTAIAREPKSRLRCQCDCGNIVVVHGSNFYRGDHTNCGCKISHNRKRASLRHGNNRFGERTKEYRAWAHIIGRCRNPEDTSYPRYGGRGITVHDEWADSFDAFLRDVGQAPSPAHSIDRIDNDAGYRPGNVRWATQQEQALNTSRTIKIDGVPLVTICRERGLKAATIRARIRRGLTPEQALAGDFKGARK